MLFFLLLNAVPGFIMPVSFASPESRRSGSTHQIGRRKKNILSDEIALRQNISLERYAAEKAYPEFSSGETIPWIDPKKFIPAKPATLSFENVVQEAKKNTSSVMRAPAPANLPVAPSETDLPLADEVFLPFEFEVPVSDPEVPFSSKQGDPLGFPIRGEHSIMTNMEVPNQNDPASPKRERGEPTTDEYKRRLNELLSGNN
jgi:hypothetical protein